MIGRDTNYLNKMQNMSLNLFNRHCKACGKRLTSVRTLGRIGRDQIISLLIPMLGSIPISHIVKDGYFHIEH